MRLPLLIFCLCVCGGLSAQILRIKPSQSQKDSTDYFRGRMALKFAANNNNSTAQRQVVFITLKSDNNASYISKKHVYHGISQYTFSKATGGPSQNRGYLHLRANFLHREKISYEFFGQGQFDVGRNLESRSLVGGGLRFALAKQVAAGTGAMFEQENWRPFDAESISIQKNLAKSSSYVSGVFQLTDQMQFSLTAYYQVGWDQAIDNFRHRTSLDTELRIAAGKRFSTEIDFVLAYEDRPIIDLSKSVYLFAVGGAFVF